MGRQDEPDVHRFVHSPNSPFQLGGDVKVCELTFIPVQRLHALDSKAMKNLI